MGLFKKLSNVDKKTTLENILGNLGQSCFEINIRFKNVIENKITLETVCFALHTLFYWWLAILFLAIRIELS